MGREIEAHYPKEAAHETTTRKLYIPLGVISTRIVVSDSQLRFVHSAPYKKKLRKILYDSENISKSGKGNMKNNLFFSASFKEVIYWRNKKLVVGSVLPQNRSQISEGLRYMSPESIRYRFLGSKKEFTEKELQYLTVLDGWNHYAIGVLDGDNEEKGIAIIRMVRSSENQAEAEVAITIIDEFQRKGLGTLLMGLMLLAAIERDIKRLSFTFLPQNEGIFHLIEKMGHPFTKEYTHDYIQVYMDISRPDLEKIKGRLLPLFPSLSKAFL